MDLDEAFILFENIIKYPITVYLMNELVSTTQNGFNALFYKVGCEGVNQVGGLMMLIYHLHIDIINHLVCWNWRNFQKYL